MKKFAAILGILGLMLAGAGSCYAAPDNGNGNSQADEVAALVSPTGQYEPGEIIVQFKPGASNADQQRARGRVNSQASDVIHPGDKGRGRIEVDKLPPGQAISAAKRGLESDPAVAFAEPNWIYQHQSTSNDPYYTNGSLWGMYGDQTTPINQYGSQAGEAWASGSTGSTSVYVGVIDEGIQYDHPDLAGNAWVNPWETVNGIDDDGNGYVDDIRGWDFTQNNNTIYDGGTKGNVDAHGTHVTGTIGARGGNGAGVVGINWNVRFISAKFLAKSGGTTANAVKAVNYLTDLKTRHGLNIVAMNNSWGGGGYSQALHDAIIRAAKADILFVAAAGNETRNTDTYVTYPAAYDTTKGTTTQTAASYDSVISVASITNTGALSSFSNYGLKSVDLGAPGSSIYSTLPYNKYGSYSGTSMATPHVTGAAALYASTRGSVSAANIKKAILGSVIATTSLNGKTVSGGRLNLGGLLAGIIGVVTDSSNGTPIVGATVTVAGTNKTATTDANGRYVIDGLNPANYNVTVDAASYNSQTLGVQVVNGAPTTQDFSLSLSG